MLFEVFQIDSHLIRENHFIVVTDRVLLPDQQFFFVGVFQAGRAGNAGASDDFLR